MNNKEILTNIENLEFTIKYGTFHKIDNKEILMEILYILKVLIRRSQND